MSTKSQSHHSCTRYSLNVEFLLDAVFEGLATDPGDGHIDGRSVMIIAQVARAPEVLSDAVRVVPRQRH